jgi:transposase
MKPKGFQKLKPLLLKRALVRANGSITEAARLLKISRQTIYTWIEKYHLEEFIDSILENRSRSKRLLKRKQRGLDDLEIVIG